MSFQNLEDTSRERVLLIYTEVLEYRIPFFAALGEKVDLTVTHSGRRMTDGSVGFREIVLPRSRLWRFHYQDGLREIIQKSKFDTVIFFMDLAWISTVCAFLFPPDRTRRVIWGLWRTGRRVPDMFRVWIARKADFNIFYSEGAAKDFLAQGVAPELISVASNTFRVARPSRNVNSHRDSILVVGSFNPRKRNDITLAAFLEAAGTAPVRLVFVGDGPERNRIELLARQSRLARQIEFHQACHDEEVLRGFYDRAICSVSHGQAGLSVLQSFAYGVPFITSRGAISGGEIENILPLENGCLTDGTQSGLVDALRGLIRNPGKAEALGWAALQHYRTRASIDRMVGGFTQAIGQKTASCRRDD